MRTRLLLLAALAAGLLRSRLPARGERADRGERDRRRRRAGQSQPRAARYRRPPSSRGDRPGAGPLRRDRRDRARRSRRAGSSPTTACATPSASRRATGPDGSGRSPPQQVAARLRAAAEPGEPQPAQAGRSARSTSIDADDRFRARDRAARRRGPISCNCSPIPSCDRPEQWRHRALSAGRAAKPAGVRSPSPARRGRDRGQPMPTAGPAAARRARRGRGRALRRRRRRPRARRHRRRPAARARRRHRRQPPGLRSGRRAVRPRLRRQSGAARRCRRCAGRCRWRSTATRSPRRSARRASPAAQTCRARRRRSCPAPRCRTGRRCRSPTAATPRRALVAGLGAARAGSSARRDAGRPGLSAALRLSAARLADDRGRGRARARWARRPTSCLIDEVAPTNVASWYLRHFTCDASAICDAEADKALLGRAHGAAPRPTARPSSRPADRILTAACAVHPPDRAGALVPGVAAADRLPPQSVRAPPGRHAARGAGAHDAGQPAASSKDVANRLPIGRDPAAVRQRIEAMEKLLERAFIVPGTNDRIGLDVMLDLIPVVGDVIAAAMGAWIVWEARNLGMSKWHIARMSGNVGFDFLLGAIPWIGAIPDFFFRSNTPQPQDRRSAGSTSIIPATEGDRGRGGGAALAGAAARHLSEGRSGRPASLPRTRPWRPAGRGTTATPGSAGVATIARTSGTVPSAEALPSPIDGARRGR